jgi:hypothetical protein
LKYYLTILILFFIFSCKKEQDQSKLKEEVTPLLSIPQKYTTIKEIKPSYKKDIQDWKELYAVNEFLGRFKKVSANEVLSNAFELQELVEHLKDSVKPSLFNDPSFKTRINILYNETLRLSDMRNIPAIKATEVHKQTEKTIDAFSAINAKINTILSKKRFEDAIDIDVKYIGLDTTKIDSVTRQTVTKRMLPKKQEDKGLRNKKL